MSEERKIMGTLEWTLLIITAAILAYIVLQNQGIHVVERTGETEVLDQTEIRKKKKEDTKQERYPTQNRESEVDQVLRDLAREFAGGESTVAAENTSMSKDEEKYIREVKKKTEQENPAMTALEWFKVIQKSHQTYNKVKDFFDTTPAPVKEQSMVAREQSNEDWTTKVSRELGIPEDNARELAASGQYALSEWAKLMEE